MRRRRRSAQEAAEPSEDEADDGQEADPGIVVIGTYDGGLLGFGLASGVQTFGYAPHQGCVKAVHCSESGKLASGGTDNSIRLFDLLKGVELGELQEHQDAISCLEFWGTTTLVTGGADGQVCVWRCGDWELLLKYRAHKAAVACLAVHRSGRLMASAGRDNGIRLWDLTRGTAAANLSAKEGIEALHWSPSGDSIAALGPKELLLVDAKTGGTAVFSNPDSAGFMRVTLSATAFIVEGWLALGDGKGDIRVIRASAQDSLKLEEACRLPVTDANRGRVKVLASAVKGLLVAGMSSGSVEVWRFPADKTNLKASDFSLLRTVDTKVRLTCLTVWAATPEKADEKEAPGSTQEDVPAVKKLKKKKKNKS